jgi:hypothetical protein
MDALKNSGESTSFPRSQTQPKLRQAAIGYQPPRFQLDDDYSSSFVDPDSSENGDYHRRHKSSSLFGCFEVVGGNSNKGDGE